MSVELLVHRTSDDITAAEFRAACTSLALLHPGVVVDLTWSDPGESAFPGGDVLFWQVDRASVKLTEPDEPEDLLEPLADGEPGHFAYVVVSTRPQLWAFAEFVAGALAQELRAQIYDPQEDRQSPIFPPSLEDLHKHHEEDLATTAHALEKKYRLFVRSPSWDQQDLSQRARTFRDSLDASATSILGKAPTEVRVLGTTVRGQLPHGLRLYADFVEEDGLHVFLDGPVASAERFDRFVSDLAGRLGVSFRSRIEYSFS